MSYHYDHQSRERAETLMEQQHYPVMEEDSEYDYKDDFPSCDECGDKLDKDWICIDPNCTMCPDYVDEEDDKA
jgi:hypothetical protein